MVLDNIRQNESDIAWDLLLSILPSPYGNLLDTARPKYRNWAPDEEIQAISIEDLKIIPEVVHRLLEDAGTNGPRWHKLIDKLDELPKSEFDAVTDYLLTMDLEAFHQTDLLQIWNALRTKLSKHLQFPDAEWSLPQSDIEKLQQCYQRYEPADPLLKKSWLFARSCNLPEKGYSDLASE